MTKSEGNFQQVTVGYVYAQVVYYDVFTVQLTQLSVFQVSYVNKFATTEGGTHVDYVSDQIAASIVKFCSKGGFQVEECEVKRHLWVFVNVSMDNPTFDSPTRRPGML